MVIDTSAALAILFDEPEHDRLAELIAEDATRLMSAASRVETGIVIESRRGAGGRKDFEAMLHAAGIQEVDFTAAHAKLALDAWRRYGKGNHPARLNFGDCCVYALCKATGEPLLFKGDDFSKTDLKIVGA